MWLVVLIILRWLLALLLVGWTVPSGGTNTAGDPVTSIVAALAGAPNSAHGETATATQVNGGTDAAPYGPPPFTVVARMPSASNIVPSAPFGSSEPAPDPADESTASPTRDVPRPTAEPTTGPRAGPVTGTRYDDPVLQWLPELKAAKSETGVAVALLAGVVRVGSNGDPNLVTPSGAMGLLQIFPDEAGNYGADENLWYEPAANALGGALVLNGLKQNSSGWTSAVRLYAARWCGGDETCREHYGDAIYAWRDYYKTVLADPVAGGLIELSDSWTPPRVAPHRVTDVLSLDFPPTWQPPATLTPTRTPSPSPGNEANATPTPTASPTATPTEETGGSPPLESPPTETATAVPTEPTPTETPTPSPTETPPASPTEDTTADAVDVQPTEDPAS
jgi:soluble lytic murein transglycosylase-like protein